MTSNPDLEQIHSEARVCTRCVLAQSRKLAVPGDGPANAPVMFIGEAPGYWENERGLPFVGAAGQLLEEFLGGIGLKRSDVYITNVLKCRPPGNRDPLPDEVSACRPFLDRQIEVIQPRVIVTLGRHSSARFFPPRAMRDLHGKPVRLGSLQAMATYHPAAVLRQPALRVAVEQDFRLISSMLEEAGPAEDTQPSPPVQAKQLDLFS